MLIEDQYVCWEYGRIIQHVAGNIWSTWHQVLHVMSERYARKCSSMEGHRFRYLSVRVRGSSREWIHELRCTLIRHHPKFYWQFQFGEFEFLYHRGEFFSKECLHSRDPIMSLVAICLPLLYLTNQTRLRWCIARSISLRVFVLFRVRTNVCAQLLFSTSIMTKWTDVIQLIYSAITFLVSFQMVLTHWLLSIVSIPFIVSTIC